MIKYLVKSIVVTHLTIAVLFNSLVLAQDQIKNDNGITITQNGDVTVFHDEFTGKYAIEVNDSTLLSSMNVDQDEINKSYFMPFFGGDIYDQDLIKLTWTEEWKNEFVIVLIREEPESYFFEESGNKRIRFLIDEKRLAKSAHYHKGPSKEILEITFTSSEWEEVIKSENTRYRISGQVFVVDQNSKNLMEQILSEHERVPILQNTSDRTAPYELQWEGDLARSAMVQPMPSNQTNEEGVITVRFEVHPDGTIGRFIPLRRMNPELEQEVMRTFRSWRFSRLPSGVPQESQWGRITFRFVKD